MDDRRCIHLLKTAVFLLVLCEAPLRAGGVAEDPYHYNGNGIVCVKCPPGMFVMEHCNTSFANSTCSPCPDHEFMDDYNSDTHCTECMKSCPKNGQEVQTCTPTTDLVCRRDKGYHRHPLDPLDPHYTCRAHTPCKTGYGEVSYGSHSNDTLCKECKVGLDFVNMSDPDHPRCEACSVCVSDSSVLSNCTLMNDTVCSENSTEISITPQTRHDRDSSGLSGGAVAGIVIVCIVVVVGIVFGIIFCQKRQQNTPRDSEMAERRGQNGNVPECTPMLKWTGPFIERRVFPFLSNQLGGEWQDFIRQLPGWPQTTSIMTVIEHKIQEEFTVPNRIMGCLMKWMREAEQGMVCKDSIVIALKAVERTDLERRLPEPSEGSSVPVENGQS